MWARRAEILIAAWLALAPAVFRDRDPETLPPVNDLASAGLVVLLAAVSWWKPLRRAHLLILPVAVWLAFTGWSAEPHPRPPASQNLIVTGLLLLMFAIVPTEASRPPPSWRAVPRGAAARPE